MLEESSGLKFGQNSPIAVEVQEFSLNLKFPCSVDFSLKTNNKTICSS